MRLLDVYRHLSGHSFSLGMTNRVRSDWLQREDIEHRERCFLIEGRETKLWNPSHILTEDELIASYTSGIPLTYWEHRFLRRETSVRAIRIDVDCDEVWMNRDHHKLTSQIRACAALGEQLGLGFSVFRTGGRGLQAIYSLPWPQTPLSASWLASKLRDALSVRLAGLLAVVDCDSTRSIMRLPLGLHAKSGSLGLFLSPDTGEIQPIEEQVCQSTRAFSAAKGATRSSHALKAIRSAFDRGENGLGIASREIEQRAWEHLPVESEFLQILLDGRIAPPEVSEGRIISVEENVTQGQAVEDSEQPGQGAELPDAILARAWAVWNCGYGAGGSNAFHLEGGIAIAKLLFGDKARERLRSQAESSPCRRPQDLEDRFTRIDQLLDTQKIGWLLSRWSAKGDELMALYLPDPEESDMRDAKRLVLAYRRVMQAQGRKVQRRTAKVVEAVAIAVLASIRRGNGIASSRALVSKVAEMGVTTNRTTVSQVLDVLSSPEPASNLPQVALLKWVPIVSHDLQKKPARQYSLATHH
jgi:hypothetical protein